jgi:putative phosphoribosyl transferase
MKFIFKLISFAGFEESERLAFFVNRVDAGKRLASALANFKGEDAVVLAIPRGGVVVAYEISKELGVPLDIIVPRKIGSPGNPELAIGAVTEDGTTILNEQLVSDLGVADSFISEESKRQQTEIRRRLASYRGDAPYPNLKDRVVIVVDDGIATGYTMKAALASVRKKGAKSIVVAIPVGPPSTIKELEKMADHVICLYTPEVFYAIGEFYQDFSQTTDEEVKTLLGLSQNQQSFSNLNY